MKENFAFRVIHIDKNNFPEFKNQLVHLYLNAFTHGKYAQHISLSEAENYIDDLHSIAEGKLAVLNQKPIAALLAYSLMLEQDFLSFHTKINAENSVYIAELMVNEDFRGKGIGTLLINNYLKENEEKYTDAFIRVWDKNYAALSLYLKLGFQDTGINILQTKKKSATQNFKMKKIYLHKKL